MKLFKWDAGRQESGYLKMLLATAMWPIPFDLYIIKYPQGSEIRPHVDPVTNRKHYRINIILKKAKVGGEFQCKDPIWQNSRIKFFRPDVSEHSVTRVQQGTRYLLSIGWVR